MHLKRWPKTVFPMAWLVLATTLLAPATALGQPQENAPRPPDPGLTALIESATDMVLVHVLDDSCARPSAAGAAGQCEGLILMRWKGLTEIGPVWFSIAPEVVRPGGGAAAASGHPPPLIRRGGRYVLSLRYAKEWGKRPFALRPFTADEAEAALEFTGASQLEPVFALQRLADRLHTLPDATALGDLEALAHSGSMKRRHAELKMEDEYCCALSPQKLQASGPKLPAYLPSLFDQSRYQAMLPAHQEFIFAWESLVPDGASGIDQAAAKGKDLSFLYLPDLKIAERRHSLPDSPGRVEAVGRGHQYVFAAVTADGEVRGLDVPAFSLVRCPDPPAPQSAPLDPVSCSPVPSGRFSVMFPDDPQIRRIVILKVRIDRDAYHFRTVGTMDLTGGAAAR